MARVYQVVLAWVIALLGGFFAVAGAVLASIGGSPYYLIVGIAMVASGALLGRGSPLGRWLFIAIWVATLVWALWEVGLDGLQLVPRVVAPTVLLILVLLTGWRARSWRSRAHAVPAVAAALVVAGLAGLVLHGDGVEAQNAPAAPSIAPAPIHAPSASARRVSASARFRYACGPRTNAPAARRQTPRGPRRSRAAWAPRAHRGPCAKRRSWASGPGG